MALNLGTIKSLTRVWNLVRGVTSAELVALQNAPFRLAVVGNANHRAWALQRLTGAPDVICEYATLVEAQAASETLILNMDIDEVRTEAGFTAALGVLARAHREQRIALAVRLPVFRPIVVDQLTKETAHKNGSLAAISALPGVLPIFDWMLPATAAGDMLILTRNQISLLLEIAACYDLPPDPKARLTELIPVVGGAFGWRALAREAVGLVPGGVGVAVKAAVAYAGTYTVGRAAGYYYASGGKKLNMNRVYGAALGEAVARGKDWFEKRAPK